MSRQNGHAFFPTLPRQTSESCRGCARQLEFRFVQKANKQMWSMCLTVLNASHRSAEAKHGLRPCLFDFHSDVWICKHHFISVVAHQAFKCCIQGFLPVFQPGDGHGCFKQGEDKEWPGKERTDASMLSKMHGQNFCGRRKYESCNTTGVELRHTNETFLLTVWLNCGRARIYRTKVYHLCHNIIRNNARKIMNRMLVSQKLPKTLAFSLFPALTVWG